eukprot:TRINITY_DN23535_c0_g1_i1.p1 TRINITY_DN23535_c0_g1~~TRINITY_DN23535_c0_g1_i1.p1  ORF type:complete len:399 (+),score=92.43 TRINITY_DN23535_c0_g1_i1:106-1302(+)
MSNMNMNINMDNMKEKLTVFGEKFRSSSSTTMAKVTEKMNIMSGKMKEFFQVPTRVDELVMEATGETLDGPDWGRNLELCDLVNTDKISSQDVVRALKKRLVSKNPDVQLLSLMLLETAVKNCDQMFSEVASERVLDEMVKIVDDVTVPSENRAKTLRLIEAWGESTEELRFLPVFEETYKSLKSRGIKFPGRDAESLAPIFTPAQSVAPAIATAAVADLTLNPDIGGDSAHTKELLDVARNSVELLSSVLSSGPQEETLKDELTTTLVAQCKQCQRRVQRLIERAGDNEPVMFEALDVHEKLTSVLTRLEELRNGKPTSEGTRSAGAGGPAVVAVENSDVDASASRDALVRNRGSSKTVGASPRGDEEAMADLDEMIFGKKGEGSSSEKKQDDLLSL